MSTLWKGQVTPLCHYKNSFDLTDSVKGPQRPLVFKNHVLRTASQIHCLLSCWARWKWFRVAESEVFLMKTQHWGRARKKVKMWNQGEGAVDKPQAFACLWTEVLDLANKESLSSGALNSWHIFVRFNLTCDSGMKRAWVDICLLSRAQDLW